MNLVEWLVALGIGLMVMAAAMTSVATQSRQAQALARQMHVEQELHVISDLIAQHVRRAGSLGDVPRSLPLTQTSASSGGITLHPLAVITPSDALTAHQLTLRAAAASNDNSLTTERSWRIRAGVMEMKLGQGNWQALTDPSRLRVTQFDVQSHTIENELPHLCTQDCSSLPANLLPKGLGPKGTTDESLPCPPRWLQRRLLLTLSAQSAAGTLPLVNASVSRQINVRTDQLYGVCP